MGTYNLPRSVKGEGRILFIFTGKSLIYTVVGGGIGLIFYFLFSLFNLNLVGICITAVFALIGFVIGTFKVPDSKKFKLTEKTGGEAIDDVIKRWFMFKQEKKKIYVYTKEDTKDE